MALFPYVTVWAGAIYVYISSTATVGGSSAFDNNTAASGGEYLPTPVSEHRAESLYTMG